MSKSKVDMRPTARPGLHDTSTSPSGGRKSTRTRSRVNDKQSPVCYKTEDEISSNDESEINFSDEVDHSTPRKSPKLYPELPKFDVSYESDLSQKLSPSKPDLCSPNDSYVSALSQCHSRTGPQFMRKEVPVTPVKGSPDKKVYPKQQNKGEVVAMIFIFIVILVVLLIFLYSRENTKQLAVPKSRVKPIEEVREDFKRELGLMIRDFSQPKNLWVQILAQVDSILVNSPIQPAVILAVVPEDSRGTATCLLHKIAKAVTYAFEDPRFIMYDVSDSRKNHHLVKLELDEVLQGLSEAHAAVIHNIENIPGEAAMIFHAYCDNENAPYKQALLLPVIEVQGYYDDLAYERLDNTVDDRLTEIWGIELQLKDVSAIISRVANAPVLIRPERKEKIKELCPI